MLDFVASTPAAIGLLVLTGVLLLVLGISSLRNRLLLFMGVRNMVRRPGQTALLLAGLVLSTVLVVASFGLNDSLTYSARQQVIQEIGQLDETVTGRFTQAQVDHYLSAIRQQPGVQSAAGFSLIVGAYHGNFMQMISQRTRLSLQINYLYGVPADFEQTFGPFMGQQGQVLHSADLRPGDAYISSSFALNNDVQVGDQVALSLGSQTVHLTIRAILGNDIAAASNDATSIPKIEVITDSSTAQTLMQTTQPVNVIGVRQKTSSGAENSEVQHFLSQLFGVPLPRPGLGFTPPPSSQIRPNINLLKTNSAANASSLSFALLLNGDNYLQFSQLVPAISLLLIGAGMLLLALLFILLAAERRAELGMSRAIGLQRRHLIVMMLIEGCGYGFLAALLGLPLGVGVIGLELLGLSRFPVNLLGSLHGLPMALYLSVSWQSLVISFCISLCVSFLVILLIAISMSRTNIVSAIRDLDDPPVLPRSLSQLVQRIRTHQPDAVSDLFAGMFMRGPLCLLLGLALISLQSFLQKRSDSFSSTLAHIPFDKVGWGMLIAGCGLLVSWLFSAIPRFPAPFARRLSYSLISIGWLTYGLVSSTWLFGLFQPTGIRLPVEAVAFDLAMTMLLFVAGAVLLVTTNVDLLVAFITAITSRLRPLAPISRVSLSYPLTYRFRIMVTVSELSLVVFLVVLIITMNIGTNDAANSATSTGGFQLSGTSTHHIPNLPSLVQNDPTLNRAIQVVAPVHRYIPDQSLQNAQPVLVSTPGHPNQRSALQAIVEDNNFYAHTTLPLQARAEGYSSDRQVWDAVIHQPNLVVIRFDGSLQGLSLGTFRPFTAELADEHHLYHQVTVIGIVSAASQWPFLYLSVATATAINGPTEQAIIDANGLGYLFQVRPGVDPGQASRALTERFGATYGLQIQQLYSSTDNASRANMTLFLGSSLALGLLFGALAIGVITSRGVIERRQQIGMLRALGFSGKLVMSSFLLESSFVILLSLLIGTGLALWVASQIISTTYTALPLPLIPLALILVGSYLVAFITTVLPSRTAASVRPAEALRYE